MSRAAAIVSDWVLQMFDGCEAVLTLPWADTAIPLVKEIAEEAQFSLTEREPKDKTTVDLVYTGVKGSWGEASQTNSCDERSNPKGLHSRLTDTDTEEVIVMDMSIVGEQGGSVPSLASTDGTLEEQVPSRACTEPFHPFQPPRIVETSDGWYQGEDCFDPGQITPVAAPQHLPSSDGELDWGGNEALPLLPEDRLQYRGRTLQRVRSYNWTPKGNKGKRSRLPEEARQDRCGLASQHFQTEVFWRKEVQKNQYFPTVDQSPIHFFPLEGFRDGLKAVP